MDRVFSVEDIPDHFWSPAPVTQPAAAEEESSAPSLSASKMMNRSASEWAFQQFLREASALDSSPLPPSSLKPVTADNEVVEIKNNCNPSTAAFAAGPPNVPMDSKEYQAYLRSRLDLACAAVALTRASSLKPQDSAAARHDNGSQRHDLPKGEDKDAGGALGLIPSMQARPCKRNLPNQQLARGSSRDLSDDDDDDDDDEVEEENMDPADAKRVRRMLSNRKSARRSRRKKQAHLTELETQVSQLRVENSSLVKRLTDISQNYNEAAVDNRVLKADVETLRVKVKMAQETVKRITGSNAAGVRSKLYMSEISTIARGMTSFDDDDDGSPALASDTPAGAASCSRTR